MNLKSLYNSHWIEILLVAGVVALALVLLPQASQESWAYPMGYPPLPPSHLRADPGVNNIELTWHPSPSYGLRGYLVYRGTTPTDIDNALNTVHTVVTGDRWLDYSAEPDQDYYYCLKAVDTLNQLSENCSNISNATVPGEPPGPAHTNELRIFVPDSGAPHGDTITVPVKIGNADGLTIYSADMWMIYDPSVITATLIRRSNLLIEYGFDYYIREESALPSPNTGVASAIVTRPDQSMPELHGEATLFEVVLKVQGKQGQISTMDLPYALEIGVNIYGTTIYTDGESALDGHDVPIIRESGLFTVTLDDPNAPSYLIGDVSPAEFGDGVIDDSDVTMARSLAVGRKSPNYRQRQVGDVNGDERINSVDAMQIQQLAGSGQVVALTRFVDRVLRAFSSTSDPVIISIGRASGLADQMVSLPIYASGVAQTSARASASDLIVNYNSSMVQLAGVRVGDLTSSFEITYTRGATQSVQIGMIPAAHNGVMSKNNGVLAYLDFVIRPSAPSGWSPVTLASARFSDIYGRDFASSDLQIPVVMENGSVGTFKIYLPVILRH